MPESNVIYKQGRVLSIRLSYPTILGCLDIERATRAPTSLGSAIANAINALIASLQESGQLPRYSEDEAYEQVLPFLADKGSGRPGNIAIGLSDLRKARETQAREVILNDPAPQRKRSVKALVARESSSFAPLTESNDYNAKLINPICDLSPSDYDEAQCGLLESDSELDAEFEAQVAMDIEAVKMEEELELLSKILIHTPNTTTIVETQPQSDNTIAPWERTKLLAENHPYLATFRLWNEESTDEIKRLAIRATLASIPTNSWDSSMVYDLILLTYESFIKWIRDNTQKE